MKVLGITGGVGSGKSEVLNFLREQYGAFVCQMDETAKTLQKKGTGCFEQIVETFGRDIVAADGELDRKKLGSVVFQDPDGLRALNRIVHPAVIRSVSQEIEQKRKEGKPLFVVEAALLPDVGADLCDEIWYIYVKENVRRERLKKSRGYTDRQIDRMMASQPSEQKFRDCSSAVIDNSGPFEDTKMQIGEMLKL